MFKRYFKHVMWGYFSQPVPATKPSTEGEIQNVVNRFVAYHKLFDRIDEQLRQAGVGGFAHDQNGNISAYVKFVSMDIPNWFKNYLSDEITKQYRGWPDSSKNKRGGWSSVGITSVNHGVVLIEFSK